ncbi:MAG: hypothetical protein NVS2B8_13360 [Vulcanimicrobiaceae bacterium]
MPIAVPGSISRARDVVELATQERDARLYLATIDFELRFARTARSDAAAQARERRTRSDEIRLTESQLREFDL